MFWFKRGRRLLERVFVDVKMCVIWGFSSVIDEDQSLREYAVSTGSHRRFGGICCFRFNGISPFLGLTRRVNFSIQITEGRLTVSCES